MSFFDIERSSYMDSDISRDNSNRSMTSTWE